MRRALNARLHHHPLSFTGLAPWPVPEVLDMQELQRNPGARCCRECGRRLLLLLLESHTWVSRRVEHVSFRDDRSVVRSVTAEFQVPDEAPVFLGDDGQHHSLVPLSVMRRKTLVNFEIRDHDDRPVALPSLRQNQAITESMLLACADALAARFNGKSAKTRREIEDFVHRVVSGTQQELLDAYDSLESGREPEVVRKLVGEHPTFKAILDRMADNFIVWVMVPTGGPRRRVLKFSCDEPLYLHYRHSGHRKRGNESSGEVHTYELGKKLAPWRLTVIAAALGLKPTLIRFPVPAAENAASFHFEIDAPKGVQIVEASLLAGPPGDMKPSFDHVTGCFPTVALHVIEVPNGSLCRAQIGLQVANRGWLLTSMASCAAVFGFLLAFALHGDVISKTNDQSVIILVSLAAAVVGFVAQSAAHELAAHLLTWTRSLVLVAAILPLIAMTFILFDGASPTHVAPALWSAAGVSGAIAALLGIVCLFSWRRQQKSVRSPWEQDHRNRIFEFPPDNFESAERKYRYTKPAMRVESAEGWHTDFQLAKRAEQELVAALSRPFSHLRSNSDVRTPWRGFATHRGRPLVKAPGESPLASAQQPDASSEHAPMP